MIPQHLVHEKLEPVIVKPYNRVRLIAEYNVPSPESGAVPVDAQGTVIDTNPANGNLLVCWDGGIVKWMPAAVLKPARQATDAESFQRIPTK